MKNYESNMFNAVPALRSFSEAVEPAVGIGCNFAEASSHKADDPGSRIRFAHSLRGKPAVYPVTTGASCRTRTGHLRFTKPLLYQMS